MSDWHDSYAALLKVAGAQSAEDFARAEPGFNRAYRAMYGAITRAKRNPRPEEITGQPATGDCPRPLADDEMASALGRIASALERSPFFQSPGIEQRAIEVGRKIIGLVRMGSIYIRRGVEIRSS